VVTSTSIALGWKPPRLIVNLNRDGDFIAELISDTGDFAVDTEIELRFNRVGAASIVWPATITGDSARWEVDKVDVAIVLDADPISAKLHYGNATSDIVWYRGDDRDLT